MKGEEIITHVEDKKKENEWEKSKTLVKYCLPIHMRTKKFHKKLLMHETREKLKTTL